ncbi:PIN domain-containing protein [Methanothermococcus sp.]|uniref:PIN domain-containing protein n=1 Tax=Methanothermococcus sp. TaxID=2614238 RepID=UPI0025DD5596|nr:PIN domain-containing protein [Methanothermococcus sp.]
MTITIPDTNFLIYAIKHNINIDYEFSRILNNYEVVILNCIKEELEKLKTQLKGKEKFSINILLSLIKKYKTEDYNNGKYADEIILNYAKYQKNNNNKIVVCTNDKDLKRKLVDMGIPIIVVKQRNYFELQEI